MTNRELKEKAAALAVAVPVEMMGMSLNQRLYGWHEVMDSLEAAAKAIRALEAK